MRALDVKSVDVGAAAAVGDGPHTPAGGGCAGGRAGGTAEERRAARAASCRRRASAAGDAESGRRGGCSTHPGTAGRWFNHQDKERTAHSNVQWSLVRVSTNLCRCTGGRSGLNGVARALLAYQQGRELGARGR